MSLFVIEGMGHVLENQPDFGRSAHMDPLGARMVGCPRFHDQRLPLCDEPRINWR